MSQINKLGYVDSKLGAPISGQQTTRILFNTITAPGTTSSLSFFKNFQGLSNGQTNISQGRLDASESMIIKTVSFMLYNATGVLNTFGANFQQTFSIIVGNQTVVKNLPIHFNQGFNGQSFDRLHTNGGTPSEVTTIATNINQKFLPCEIRLLTDIVLPPQVNFEVRVSSTNAVYGTGAVVCALSGYGKIFSAGNSF